MTIALIASYLAAIIAANLDVVADAAATLDPEWRPPETGWQPLCGKCPDCLAWAEQTEVGHAPD